MLNCFSSIRIITAISAELTKPKSAGSERKFTKPLNPTAYFAV